MALYPRLMKLEEPGIAVHEFYAMAGEFARERVGTGPSCYGLRA
jgi:hypothetical protein